MMDVAEPSTIMIVIGTRPEGIKLAPVIAELKRLASYEPIKVLTCVTGQHREMLDQVLDLFSIIPDINLHLMKAGQTPSEVAARVLLELEHVLRRERPSWIVVQGDTTTVMAAAIAAYHLRIRIAHVEAGLRTGDRFNPFPEEMNRLVTGQVSDLHFAPTEQAHRNLLHEGIRPQQIHVTGNTVVDALLEIAARPSPPHLRDIVAGDKRLILVTAHRRENFGDPLRGICCALKTLAQREALQIVYPVHLNPNVHKLVYDELSKVSGITLLPPVDYLTLVHLMKSSYLILTDSGGIQEEAPSLGVPVLVLREVTERPEAVAAGVVRVVGTNPDRIVEAASILLDDPQVYARMARTVNPYGDGHAAERIARVLVHAAVSRVGSVRSIDQAVPDCTRLSYALD